MNPPFARQLDHDFVLRAYEMLKPGGVLVSVMAAGVKYRDTAKSKRIRQLTASPFSQDKGFIRNLPDKSFRESGTDIHTVVVRIIKGEGR